ncbi:MAG: SDR family oxidoreductase [Planctomycetota bacterium]|nr:SDR family oxidoreductase [Planctomycetota bacterium]
MALAAIITGAGSGIGRHIATQLAAKDYRLALVGRRGPMLEETASMCRGAGHVCIAADLEDPRACEGAADEAVRQLGRLDALVNNAGWSPAATIPQTTVDIASRVFAINAIAPCLLIARVWPTLERLARDERRGGVVVNVSSMATVDPFPMLYAYAAAKAGVNSLARSVAIQGRPLGIRGFAVAPGAVETALLRTIVPEKVLPTSKTLRPERVANVVVECVLGDRDGQNGETILLPSP